MQKRVKVKPNSKTPKIVEAEDGTLIVHLKSQKHRRTVRKPLGF